MFGGNMQQPMDFRDYTQGQFGAPYYPNPMRPYGPFIGPSSFQSAGAGYMPLAGMPSYGRSMQYAAARRRTGQLHDYVLKNDPRGELLKRTLGIGDGILSDLGVGAMNRPGINHLFGGDIRQVANASMLAASGGIHTRHGQTFAGGMLQQAYATEIANVVTGGMDSRGMTNGLGVGRTAETVAALSAVPGNRLAGRILHQGGGRIGMSNNDKADLEGVIDSSTKLVRDLEQIFGDGSSVSDLFAIAKRVTGKVVRTQKDAEDMSRKIRSIAAQGAAAGLDERAMFDVLSQGNRFNTSVSAPVNLAMNTATAPGAMAAARAGGVDVKDALNVHQQNAAVVARSPAVQRSLVAYARAQTLREAGKVEEALQLENLAEGLNMSNMAERSAEMEPLMGNMTFEEIDLNDRMKQVMMEEGSDSRAGKKYLASAVAGEVARQQNPERRKIVDLMLGEEIGAEDKEAVVEALKMAGGTDLFSTAAEMKKGTPWNHSKMDIFRQSVLGELDEDQQEVVRKGARVIADQADTGQDIIAMQDRGKKAFDPVWDTSVNAILQSASNLQQSTVFSEFQTALAYDKESNLPFLDFVKGLAGSDTTRGFVTAMDDIMKVGNVKMASVPGLELRGLNRKDSKKAVEAIRSRLEDEGKGGEVEALLEKHTRGTPQEQLSALVEAGMADPSVLEVEDSEGALSDVMDRLIRQGKGGEAEAVITKPEGDWDYTAMLGSLSASDHVEAVPTIRQDEDGNSIGTTNFLTQGSIGKAREMADNLDFDSSSMKLGVFGKLAGEVFEADKNLIKSKKRAFFTKNIEAHMVDPAVAADYLLDAQAGESSELAQMLNFGNEDKYNKTLGSLAPQALGYLETVLESKNKKDLSDNDKQILKDVQARAALVTAAGKAAKGAKTDEERTYLGTVSFNDDQGNRVVLVPQSD